MSLTARQTVLYRCVLSTLMLAYKRREKFARNGAVGLLSVQLFAIRINGGGSQC